ncbi:hypothetical protein WG906_15585 [Pedobacter sp. P351]|uniref:HYC_CC_PP family protein n=1 Tax=Pedobacter superstes TaxID=3133441 RepID=UPI00309C38B7
MKLFRSYIVLALAMLITLSASGISVSLHKCCGSIEGISLFGNSKECKMAKRQTPKDCPEESKTSINKKSCCTDQKISFTQTTDKTSPVTAKNQVKETKQNFDVLFFYTLITSFFSSSEQEEEIQKPSPGLFITEALILLLQQFRI